MKILFFLINLNLGGTEKSFLNLISELPDHYSIDLLLLEHKGELLKDLPPNVNVRTIENSKEINEFLNKGSRRFAFEEFKRRKYYSSFHNLIIFILYKLKVVNHPFYGVSSYLKNQNGNYDYAVAFAGIHNFIAYYTLKHIKAKKKYLWVHFDVNEVISNPNFGKKFYPGFDNIVCVSENAKSAFINMFPKLKQKTKVFNNIVSPKMLLDKAEEGDSFNDGFAGIRIVTLGRLSEEKGQSMIPNIVRRLKDDGFSFRWYLIGDGKLRESIEKDIIALNIINELVLLGSRLNPYPYLQDCDLYVQTSLHEGYCITIHEAKVFKKPVVTTNFLSASNLIADEKDGLIVDISEDGIYQGVKRLLDNEGLRKKVSRSKLISDTSEIDIDDLFQI